MQAGPRKAMILAAGLARRLRPMTDHKPKALLSWQGKPLIDHVALKLKEAGFDEIIINVHHHAEMIMDHVRERGMYGIRVEFSHERERLYDTGGGIAHAAWFFGEEPFLVHNVDILSSIDLQALWKAHLESDSVVTLAVKERVTSRSLLMDREGYLKGWRDNRSGETLRVDSGPDPLTPIAFSAIHVADPVIFKHLPEEKSFPLIPFYLELAGKLPVRLYRHDGDRWTDMGKKESYVNQ